MGTLQFSERGHLLRQSIFFVEMHLTAQIHLEKRAESGGKMGTRSVVLAFVTAQIGAGILGFPNVIATWGPRAGDSTRREDHCTDTV